MLQKMQDRRETDQQILEFLGQAQGANPDPILASSAPPGIGMTQDKGKWQWEQPPLISNPDTGEASNAFVTLFASFHLDYGYFAPFAVCIYIILVGFFIRTFNLKTRAILYVWFNFSLYISLFQADILSIFSSTLILIIIFIGIKNIIFFWLRRIVIQ